MRTMNPLSDPKSSSTICPESGQIDSLLESVPEAGLPAEEEKKALTAGRWEPKQLNPRHREIMRRILEGATYVDIAISMGISTQAIMLVCTSKMFREELSKLEKESDYQVIQRAEAMSNEALDKLKVLMRTARSEFLQKQCAERILDTAGYSKIEKKIMGIVSGEDVIKELNRRKRESVLGKASQGPPNYEEAECSESSSS